jgi:prepilin-type N-terminal cleavage/methylation domain-containing protein
MAVERATAGYTLLELLLVVCIVALLTGIAGIASGASDTQHLDMAEVQILDALAWAQAQARSNRAPVAVVFDLTRDRFALVDEHGALLTDPLTRAGYLVSFQHPNQPRLVDIVAASFGTAGLAVIFDAQGVPLTGGAIILEAGPHRRVLAVDAATGAVSSS